MSKTVINADCSACDSGLTGVNSPYLTAEETAHWLRCSKNTVWNLIKSGQLPAQRIGSRIVRIKREDIEALATTYKGGDYSVWNRNR